MVAGTFSEQLGDFLLDRSFAMGESKLIQARSKSGLVSTKLSSMSEA